ncbi:MAG: diaminopimelate epimerase [Bacteroidetes bacterium]|nr:diaminopimelate epimerase [Bacteroidota bacterium]
MFPSDHYPFKKIHGAGNDFIIMRSPAKIPDHNLIAQLCDRHFGIGANGLILLSEASGIDFKMQYFNADGHEGTLCGNGGRAAAVFAYLDLISRKKMRFEAIDGIHHAEILQSHKGFFDVEISMKDITHYDLNDDRLLIDTGSPHYVKRCDNLSAIDVIKEGAAIRHDKNISQNGVNVNFMQLKKNEIHLRTFERGVENETLSCGTGVTAAAIAAALWYDKSAAVVNTKGGRLEVRFSHSADKFTNIWLRGPVQFVFEGSINLNQKQIYSAF